MQVCTSLQTNNHANTPPLSFFTGRMPFLPPNQQRQTTEGNSYNYMEKKSHTTLVFMLVLLTMTYYIHHHILRKSKHWNHWIAIYRCLYILNTKSIDISQSHSAFNFIQSSRNSHSMCICLLWCSKQETAMNDEWELQATNGKSEFDVNESVNPPDFTSA